MTLKAVKYVFKQSPYTGAAYVVHIVLAAEASGQGTVWVNTDEVAEVARCAASTVDASISTMVKDGYLVKLKKDKRRTLYQFVERPRQLCLVNEEPKQALAKDYGFDKFWEIYPSRTGKRLVGKAKSLELWAKLNLNDRRLAYKAAQNYAVACKAGVRIPRDPERFLKDHFWRDWIDADPDEATPPRPPHVPTTAVWNPTRNEWN